MDLINLDWKLTGSNVSCPQVRISARFADSNNHAIIKSDLRESEGKSILFPNIIASLTGAEKQELMEDIVASLLKIYRNRIGE